jgi:hypothetical protein
LGARKRRNTRSAIKPTPRTSVGRLVCGRLSIQLANFCQVLAPLAVVPAIVANGPPTTSNVDPDAKDETC